MSSVPYVPPDTMKNVAATSGQRVSFAVRLVGEIARVGNWAGRDIVLNLLSRPPCQRPSRSSPEHSARVRRTQNTGIRGRCKRYLHSSENFCPAQVLSNAFSADYYCGVPRVFASRLCRASSAHIVRCSAVKTLQTFLRVSIFICFAFFCLWSSFSVLSFCIALSWS